MLIDEDNKVINGGIAGTLKHGELFVKIKTLELKMIKAKRLMQQMILKSSWYSDECREAQEFIDNE